MEIDIRVPPVAVQDADSIQRVIALVVIGYFALLGTAIYLDHKIHQYRVRKRRERETNGKEAT